jgi:hypothetical protein
MTGAVMLVLAGTLARGAELFDVRVEAGVEVGRQSLELIDGDLDYSTTVFQPYVSVSRYGNGPCFSLRVRGLFAVDEDTEIDDLEYETQTNGFDIQGLVGFGISLPMIKIAPVIGLSFRDVSTTSDADDGDGDIDYEFDMLLLEIGVHAEASFGKLRAIAQVTVGPVIAGQSELKYDAADINDDADIGFFEGYHLELRGGIDYKIAAMASLHVGLAYERFADETDEFSDLDETSEDEFNRITFVFGVSVTF